MLEPTVTPRETSGVTTQLILGYVEERGGAAAVEELLRLAGVPDSAEELRNESRWVSYETRIRLFEAAVQVLDDPRCTFGMGATSLRIGINHSLVLVLRALGSPRQVYRQMPRSVPKFSTTSTMEILDCGPTSAVFRYRLHDGYRHSRLDCLYAQGLMSVVPEIFGLPPAELVHDECESDGAPACVYHLRWRQRSRLPFRRPKEVKEDPELRALRGQLQKLQSAASELAGEGDLDTVLRRITERAAAAVLAPAHLLAVRDPDTDRLLVHSSGLPDDDLQHLAERLVAGEDLGPHVVAVEVRSARRLHGGLAAFYPARQRGPANERPMLTAYAGHAAAALDLLLALETSRRGESRAAALLALAHQLRSASDAQHVAEVVSAMLPQIVGSDSASVRMWDATAGELRTLASSGFNAEQADAGARPIRIDDTPELAALLTHQVTSVHRAGSAPPALEAWLAAVHLEGVAVTPLVADQTFLGVATACWRPGGMPTDDREVIARLQGVGEYAATALQNARLWATVRHQSLHDALTGLPNRVLLGRVLEEALANAAEDYAVSVLYCDLDRFKRVNDSWGHPAGDELLRQVAARLRAVLRPGDLVGRLSGDEFALLLPGVAEPDVAYGIAERVLACFDEPFRIEGRTIRVSTSVGVASSAGPGGRVEQLLRAADAGMYAAKQRGRNQIAVGGDPVTAGIGNRDAAELDAELRGALARGEMRLVFQPVVGVEETTGTPGVTPGTPAGVAASRLLGAEALLRWQHPRLGLLAPAAFLTSAEELGLIADFDLWTVRTACAALGSWTSGPDPLHVAVNLSSAALLDPRLHDTVRQAVTEAGIEPRQLHLEVVESRDLLDVPVLVERLVALRRLGVLVSLDDFGTGFSTLAWLQRLPVDQIKLDRTFTAELGTDGSADALVRGVVALARELGVGVVAEGVETDEQLRGLHAAGCRVFQGYLLGRPVAAPPSLVGAVPATRR